MSSQEERPSGEAATKGREAGESVIKAQPDAADGAAFLAALPADRLYRPADLSTLSFQTTLEIEPIQGPVGQKRAVEAIRFGTRMRKSGFNLFVIGSSDARMQQAVEAILMQARDEGRNPPDWIYVNNFKEPHKPIAIQLPSGRAIEFRNSMRELVDDLKIALPTVFESEDYQTRRGSIDQTFRTKQGEAFSTLRDKAGQKGIVIVRTPLGFALAPARNGEVVPPEEFATWPDDKRRETQEAIQVLEKDLEHIMYQVPQWEKAHRDEIRKLNRDMAMFAVRQSIEEAKADFAEIAKIVEYLEAVRDDLIENVAMFVTKEDGSDGNGSEDRIGASYERYEVNVFVSHAENQKGVPIVEEMHPTLGNLIGSIEYASRQGVLVTNFRHIKPGAAHRANGGFLLLDVRQVLMEPFSWAALKRTLRQQEIRIEDVGRLIGLTSTISLEPDPIPLDLKVVLFGSRALYYLLVAFDPEVSEHFKVLADFEDEIDRSPENEAVHVRLIASVVTGDGLKPIDRDGVALVLERAARIADDSGKLTLLVDQIRDLLAEADYWAKEAGRQVITRVDIQKALDQKAFRASRLRDKAQETILQRVALIDTSGSRVGQVNGLSVLELGGYRFGRPSRITCRVRPGAGKVVDIEREVELGGPIHSKGVLILSGFLAGRFALNAPMSLFASLVFEQSYGGVEGDSASSAELYALLSALSELPLRQDLAVTGSVNQHGDVQAIGGVNEKIEGFFDICRARTLTGTQGVLIPKANVQHLMLQQDVIDACAAGQFAIYPVATVDEGISLLAGRDAGESGVDGRYRTDSINGRVEERLRSFARIRQSFGQSTMQELASGQSS